MAKVGTASKLSRNIEVAEIKVGDYLKHARSGRWVEVGSIDLDGWDRLIFLDKGGKRITRRLKYSSIQKANHRTAADAARLATVAKPMEQAATVSVPTETEAKVTKSRSGNSFEFELSTGSTLIVTLPDGTFIGINADGTMALGAVDRITQLMEIHRPTSKNRPWVISAWNDKTPVTD